MDIIRRLDSFGVPFNLNIQHTEKQYRSALGGIATILLYTLSLIYFIYKIYAWQSKLILPSITQQSISKTYSEVNFTNTISLEISTVIYDGIDPFNQSNALVLCFFGYYQGGLQTNLTLLEPIINQSTSKSSIIRPDNMSLILNSGNKTNETPLGSRQAFLYLKICNNETASLYNFKCAPSDSIDKYFSRPQTFDLQIHTQSYDVITQTLKTVVRHIYYNMDIDSPFYGQIDYHITQHYVDDNLIIQSSTHQNYISNFNMLNQPVSQKYVDASGFVSFLISISSNQVEQYVQYPKLGQILADVGSIVSLLLSLSIVIQIFNSKQLEDQLFYDMISIYFPEYKKYKIQKNIFGKITSITQKNNQVNKIQFLQQYEILKEKAKDKFSIINITYEISRLQFIIQTLVDRTAILQSHQMGIKLLNQTLQQSIQDSFVQNKSQLVLDDFTLLSMQQFYQINDEEEQINISRQPVEISEQT